jgi:hypothetical protein
MLTFEGCVALWARTDTEPVQDTAWTIQIDECASNEVVNNNVMGNLTLTR